MRMKDRQLLEISKMFAEFSTCQSRKVGALIASESGHVISTGYNGAPKKCDHPRRSGEQPTGQYHCVKSGCACFDPARESGTQHHLLRCSHAELNAIAQAAYEGVSTRGGRLYCTTSPCSYCAKAIIQAGIAAIVFEERYPDEFAFQLLHEAGVHVICLDEDDEEVWQPRASETQL